MRRSVGVSMVVVDGLVPNRHQVINNNHADSTMMIISSWLWITSSNIHIQARFKQTMLGLRLGGWQPIILSIFYYGGVRLLTTTTLYAKIRILAWDQITAMRSIKVLGSILNIWHTLCFGTQQIKYQSFTIPVIVGLFVEFLQAQKVIKPSYLYNWDSYNSKTASLYWSRQMGCTMALVVYREEKWFGHWLGSQCMNVWQLAFIQTQRNSIQCSQYLVYTENGANQVVS